MVSVVTKNQHTQHGVCIYCISRTLDGVSYLDCTLDLSQYIGLFIIMLIIRYKYIRQVSVESGALLPNGTGEICRDTDIGLHAGAQYFDRVSLVSFKARIK